MYWVQLRVQTWTAYLLLWNFNVCSICTGVTYTNPQVREAPGFSLQSAGFMWLRQPAGFEKNVKCVSK